LKCFVDGKRESTKRRDNVIMENRVQRRTAPLLQDEEDQNCAEIRSLFTPCTYEACLRVVFLIICSYYPFYNLVTIKLNICRAITYIACILLLFSIAPQPLTLTHVRKLFQDWWNLIIFGITVILVITNSILWEIHFAPEEKYCKSIRISKLRKVCYISHVCILRGFMFILLNLALLLQAIRISDDDTNIISLSIEDTDVQNIVTEIRRHTFHLRQKSNGLTGIWWLMFLLPWVCIRIFAFYINALDAHTRGDHLCLAFWSTDILQTAMSLTILQKLGKVGKRCKEEVCRYEEKHCVFIKEKEQMGFYIPVYWKPGHIFNSFIISPFTWASALVLPIVSKYILQLCSEWPIQAKYF